MTQPPHPQPPWGNGPGGPPARGPLRPVAGLGVASCALAVVVTALTAVDVLRGTGAGSAVTSWWGVTNALGPAWVAAFVVTCAWLSRVRRNAEVVAPTFHHVRSRGWVWWGWLVPVVSFWFPYQVVRDCLDASAGAAPGRARRPRVGLWWAGFLVGQGVSGTASGADVVPGGGGSSASGVGLVGLAGSVVALVLWFRIVATFAALQSEAG